MPDGYVTINIDENNNVTATPDEAKPDENNNIVFTLVDDSIGNNWVFNETNPITIANPANFTVRRVANGELHVYDSGEDKARIPTHKYTLHFTGNSNRVLNFDPMIRDRGT